MAGQITTPIDLISLTLKTSGVLGVGQTADFEDANDVFAILNSMIAQWNRERFLVYHLIDVSILATGAQSYTVGPNGDFNIPRPDRLETAYARLLPPQASQTYDYPLTLIDSREDYSSITLKQLKTFPNSIFYDSDWPLGRVYIWPIPSDDQFELHLVVKETLKQFPDLTTPISLPPEYMDMLIYNLSVRVRPLYQLPPDPTTVALAKNALAVIRTANAQIPTLRMPAAVLNSRHGSDLSLGNMNALPFAH